MNSFATYLISGSSNRGATGSMQVIGMDKFSIVLQGQSFGTGVAPATGKIDIQSRVEGSSPYVNIYSVTFGGNSGVIFNYEYPIESLRAVINDTSPSPTGTFNVVVRCASYP